MILLGLCQVLCAVSLFYPKEVFFYLGLIAFILACLEAATTDERSVLTIIFILTSIGAMAMAIKELFLHPSAADLLPVY